MEEQVQSQPNEIKIQQIIDEEEDRISDLHDCLLLDILSHLDSTKEAIKIGVLSKRWQHLWPSVPILTFLHPKNNNGLHLDLDPDPNPDPDFFSFVNHTLTQCRQLNLNKFKLQTVYGIQFESLVNEWSRYAVNLNVKEFDLTFCSNGFASAHNLDQICFINSNFNRLSLRGCILKPTGGISLTNLKSLSLGCGKVDGDLIQNILSGSLVLETLNLLFVYGIRWIDISSKSVKNLRFSGGFMLHEQYSNSTHVEINAPYISSLKIYSLILSKLVLLNVSSLVKAELDYALFVDHSETTGKELESEILKGLILKLRHVKELKLRDLCLVTL